MTYFAVFRNYLVTANADGSIPINAKIVAELTNVNETLLQDLLQQANEWDENP